MGLRETLSGSCDLPGNPRWADQADSPPERRGRRSERFASYLPAFNKEGPLTRIFFNGGHCPQMGCTLV